jgi:hypothetical protein
MRSLAAQRAAAAGWEPWEGADRGRSEKDDATGRLLARAREEAWTVSGSRAAREGGPAKSWDRANLPRLHAQLSPHLPLSSPVASSPLLRAPFPIAIADR